MHTLPYQIIAEVKTKSPFGYKSTRSWQHLFKIAEQVGDIISVHTDPRWGGSFDLLREARSMTQKPILAKGIHCADDDIREAIDAGADKVLVVGRLPKVHLESCLIEPWDFDQIDSYPDDTSLVWNSRDLDTGRFKRDASIQEVREKWNGWLCQASNILTRDDVCEGDDVRKGVNAIIVGEGLEGFAQSIKSYMV